MDQARVQLSCGPDESDKEGVDLSEDHSWSLHPVGPNSVDTEGKSADGKHLQTAASLWCQAASAAHHQHKHA